ncbi:hypothetical protein HanIR_Chr14g0681991 [Helianthus annuus]|nr:hypothetical protein HanIR_Chr14g0681991 [Helianthus annuus]
MVEGMYDTGLSFQFYSSSILRIHPGRAASLCLPVSTLHPRLSLRSLSSYTHTPSQLNLHTNTRACLFQDQ